MTRPSPITLAELRDRQDFDAAQARVQQALDAAVADDFELLRFMARYTSWNGYFGSAVAALAAKVGRTRGLFLDRDEPILQLADRSVFVASFFFDAARDEFDDRDTVHRDTHRCLAQAVLAGLIKHQGLVDPVAINAALADPPWLDRLQEGVAQGYGVRTPDTADAIFRAIGYHLGSEVLADQEFSLIDATLRTARPELTAWLAGQSVTIAGQEHGCYQWIRIHSGHGGGVEADHFNWAVKGLRRGFRFSDPAALPALKEQVLVGFDAFAKDHATFFGKVAGA